MASLRAVSSGPSDPTPATADPSPVAVSLCGGLRIEIGSRRVDERMSRQARLLIAYLALHRDRPVKRDELVDVLWGDHPPAAPRAALSVLLSRTRHALGAAFLVDLSELALGLPPAAAIDVERALAAADAAQRALESGRLPDAIAQANQALATLERPLLPDLECDWLDEHRRHLGERHVLVLETLAEAALAAGEHVTAERAARSLVEHDRYRESGHALLMRSLEATGNRAEALLIYDRLRVLLREEMGMTPSGAVRELAERMLNRDTVAAPAAPRAVPAGLRRDARHALRGREAELERLLAWWRRPGEGVRLCGLSGDAGIGKTRLAAELAVRAHTDGACVLYGRSDEEELPLPYQPVIESMRQLLARNPALAERVELADELAELARLVPEVRTAGEAVREPPGDPQLRRYRLFEAVTTLLTSAAEREPLLLILDDLHWADEPTAALLRHLLRAETKGRLAVLALSRTPELSPDHSVARALADAARERPIERIALTGLGRGAITQMVSPVAPRGATPEFLDALVSETGGNPLFLEEILRELGESSGLDERPADVADLTRVGVPEGVQVVLGRRLGRLGAEATERLAEAAAIGLEFDLPVLEQLAGAGRDVLETLERATAGGILVERTPPGRFAFAHALVRDAVYARQSGARRARVHGRLARLLEARPELGARPGDLARHWNAAGEPGPALEASLTAARAAADVGAFDEALGHYENALGLWAAVREAGTELGVLEDAAEAARWSGKPARAAELVQRAMPLVRRAADPDPQARHARLHERLGRFLWEAGDWERSQRAYAAALSQLQGRTDIVETARALGGQAWLLMLQERFPESLELAERALGIARALGARREESHALNTYGVDLALTGRVEEGLAALRESLRIAEDAGNLEEQCRAYCNLAELLIRAGQTAEAAEIALAGYRFARRHGLERSGAPIIAANGVSALARLGRWDEALALADESLAAGLPDGVGACLRLTCARLLALRGERERAASELAAAEAVVRDTYEPIMFTDLAEAVVEIALLDGDLERARAEVERGLAPLVSAEEEGELTLRVCALGLRVAALSDGLDGWAADLAERSERVAAAMAQAGVMMPAAAAYALACAAGRARLRGEASAQAWAAAAQAFHLAGDVHATACAGLEEARAWLAEHRVEEARAALTRARSLADALDGAPSQRIPLDREIVRLDAALALSPPGTAR
jgi:DNA-binding SARP family transcriptional activator